VPITIREGLDFGQLLRMDEPNPDFDNTPDVGKLAQVSASSLRRDGRDSQLRARPLGPDDAPRTTRSAFIIFNRYEICRRPAAA